MSGLSLFIFGADLGKGECLNLDDIDAVRRYAVDRLYGALSAENRGIDKERSILCHLGIGLDIHGSDDDQRLAMVLYRHAASPGQMEEIDITALAVRAVASGYVPRILEALRILGVDEQSVRWGWLLAAYEG